MYRQLNQTANVAIEQNTANVPADGRYYVLKGSNIIASFKNLKPAQIKYKELIDSMNLPVIIDKPSKISREHMMNEFYLIKSNNAILGTSFGSYGKKSGRFRKSR